MKSIQVLRLGLLTLLMVGSAVAAESQDSERRESRKRKTEEVEKNQLPCCCLMAAGYEAEKGELLQLPLLHIVEKNLLPEQHNLKKDCCKHLVEKDEAGRNIMHYAALVGNKRVIAILAHVLDSSFLLAPNAYGKTPFHYAVAHENSDIFFTLLQKTEGQAPEGFVEGLSEYESESFVCAVDEYKLSKEHTVVVSW